MNENMNKRKKSENADARYPHVCHEPDFGISCNNMLDSILNYPAKSFISGFNESSVSREDYDFTHTIYKCLRVAYLVCRNDALENILF